MLDRRYVCVLCGCHEGKPADICGRMQSYHMTIPSRFSKPAARDCVNTLIEHISLALFVALSISLSRFMIYRFHFLIINYTCKWNEIARLQMETDLSFSEIRIYALASVGWMHSILIHYNIIQTCHVNSMSCVCEYASDDRMCSFATREICDAEQMWPNWRLRGC